MIVLSVVSILISLFALLSVVCVIGGNRKEVKNNDNANSETK